MRRLAHLYSIFLFNAPDIVPSNNAADMLLCKNFQSLEDVIDHYTCSDKENQKAGQKNQLYYFFLKVSKNVNLKKEFEDFVLVLKHRKDDIFGDAIYDLNERRNVSLKKPNTLPLESDIGLIKKVCLRGDAKIPRSVS